VRQLFPLCCSTIQHAELPISQLARREGGTLLHQHAGMDYALAQRILAGHRKDRSRSCSSPMASLLLSLLRTDALQEASAMDPLVVSETLHKGRQNERSGPGS